MDSGELSLLAPFELLSADHRPDTCGPASMLRTVGVPRRVELDGWIGPALFVSAIQAGRASTLVEVMPSASACGTALVLGRHEEPDGSIVHALVVLDGEEVWLVETDGARVDRFVASDLERFLCFMAAFVRMWPDPSREGLRRIDPRAMDEADGFWPALIESVLTE